MLFWSKEKKKDWECSRCRNLNSPDIEFCEYCGHPKLKTDIVAETPAVISKPSRKMMHCPICGADNKKDNSFCEACGSAFKNTTLPTVPVQQIVPEPPKPEVLIQCVHCGTMNTEHNRFCSHCFEEVRVPKEQMPELESIMNVSLNYCPECGTQYASETIFCNECGAKLTVGR